MIFRRRHGLGALAVAGWLLVSCALLPPLREPVREASGSLPAAISQPRSPAGRVASWIRGEVRGLADLGGVDVTAYPVLSPPSAESFSTATDRAGRFDLAVPDGIYNVVASKKGTAFRAIRWHIQAATSVDLDLEPTGSLKGTVIAPGLGDVTGTEVFIPGTGFFGTTTKEGAYSLGPLPVGSYLVVARRPGFALGKAENVRVEAAATTQAAAIALVAEPAVGSLAGRAVLADATPSAGIKIVVVGPAGFSKSTTTGADGSYSLGGVPAAVVTVSAEIPGYFADSFAFPVFPEYTVNLPAITMQPRYLVGTFAGPPLGTLEDFAPELRPNAYALDSAGNLYMTTGIASQFFDNQILKFNLQTTALAVVAGSVVGNADGVGTAAQFDSPEGMALDGQGNMFVADSKGRSIRKVVLSSGAVSTLVGNFNKPGNDDGLAASASFFLPTGIAYDGTGSLYVSDSFNHNVRRVDMSNGLVTTIAGASGSISSGKEDGVGTAARFKSPQQVWYDVSGSLYVADEGNCLIRKISLSSKLVSTVAGSSCANLSGTTIDGLGSVATFKSPFGLVGDKSGNLYVGDFNQVRKITLSTTSVASVSFNVTPPLAGRFKQMALDSQGNLFLSESGQTYPAARVLNLNQTVQKVLKSVGPAKLGKTRALALDGTGGLYVADQFPGAASLPPIAVRKFNLSTGSQERFAGGLINGIADGQGTGAQFAAINAFAFDATGSLWATDDEYLRRISMTTGNASIIFDSNGKELRVRGFGLDFDKQDRLYVSSPTQHVIKQVDYQIGSAKEVVGFNSFGGGNRDGVGLMARLKGPKGLIIDRPAGVMYVADTGNHLIRKVDLASMVVTTVAGRVQGNRDGIGPDAQFNSPSALALGMPGWLYVLDSDGNSVRRIHLPTGAVNTIAGSSRGFVDGLGRDAAFDTALGIAIDAAGSIYLADAGNSRIRKIIRN